jgi:cation:H+ antiporter
VVYVMFVLGLVGLFFGGEFLVRGAVGIARKLSVPPLVIGLTVVGFGTSTPELLVSVQAALAGAPAIAIGNVIGSNIANILLILGLTAIIMPVAMPIAETKRDFVVMISATLVLWAILIGGTVWLWQGLLLIAALAGYLFASFRGQTSPSDSDLPASTNSFLYSMLFVLAGLAALIVGAKFLVDSASEIARDFGVSEAVIGLSVVAVGTSLPELATSALAALRAQSQIAVGNILGSNIFNILGILGVTALVAPIPVDPRFAELDIMIALAAALAMLGFAVFAGRINRIGGGLLMTAYAGYMVLLA